MLEPTQGHTGDDPGLPPPQLPQLQPTALNRSIPQTYLRVQRHAEQLDLELTGLWRALHFAELDAELSAVELDGARQVRIDTREAELDLQGMAAA